MSCASLKFPSCQVLKISHKISWILCTYVHVCLLLFNALLRLQKRKIYIIIPVCVSFACHFWSFGHIYMYICAQTKNKRKRNISACKEFSKNSFYILRFWDVLELTDACSPSFQKCSFETKIIFMSTFKFFDILKFNL